jgi:TPP-dependent pyruvate/acetoin dehydrogenase alpha subunit
LEELAVSPGRMKAIRAEEDRAIREAVETSLTAAWPDVSEAFLDVQTAGGII